MTKEERQTLKKDASRTDSTTAFELGQIVMIDEMLEQLEDCTKEGISIAAAEICMRLLYEPKKADLAEKIAKRYGR